MKKLSLSALLAFLSATSASAVTTGFTAGNDLTATPIQGVVSVQCQENGQTDYARYRCDDTVLDPAEYSYFVTESGTDADSVTLTATWPDGKTVSKKEGFDPATGKSTGAFNLWISTLLQRPLLDVGANQVRFALSKNGQVRREGEFTATIRDGQVRGCRDGFEMSYRLADCRVNGDAVCDSYFRHQNYCQ